MWGELETNVSEEHKKMSTAGTQDEWGEGEMSERRAKQGHDKNGEEGTADL